MGRLSKDQAAKLLAERDEIDPALVYMRRLAGATALEILKSDTLYRLVTSANQGGKTTVSVVECASLLRGINPWKPFYGPISVLIIVPSRAQASGIWGKRLLQASDIRHTVTTSSGKQVDLAKLPLIPKSEIAVNAQGKPQIIWAYSPQGKYPGFVRMKNGSEFRIALSGDTKSWERVQGFTYDMVYRDEAAGNESLHPELLMRLIAARTAYEEKRRPWGGGICWVATETLINPEFMEYRKRCSENVPNHCLFWMDPAQNPAVSMAVRDSMRTAMSAEDASIRLDGHGSAVDDVLIYRQQWNTQRHVLAEDYEPGPEDNLWISYDPGWDHPYGILCCCITPDKPLQIKVVRFYNAKHQTLDQVALRIAEWLDGRFLEGLVCDPAARKTDHNRGESLYIQLEKLLTNMRVDIKRGILFGRNIYEDTIPLVQRYLDPDPGNRSCDPLVVVNPTSPGCGVVVEQMMKYRRKNSALDARHHYSVYAKDNEAPDCLRYLISRQPAWQAQPGNPSRTVHLRPSLYPPVQKRVPGPYDVTPDMTEEQRVHAIRLQLSARTADRLTHHGEYRHMLTGPLSF